MANQTVTAGSMRESVRFERRSTTSDGMGNTTGSWVPFLTGIPARIVPGRGMERLIAEGVQAVATATVWIRSSSETRAILASDRCVNTRTGAAYNIHQILNADEHNRFLQMVCETGVAD